MGRPRLPDTERAVPQTWRLRPKQTAIVRRWAKTHSITRAEALRQIVDAAPWALPTIVIPAPSADAPETYDVFREDLIAEGDVEIQ